MYLAGVLLSGGDTFVFDILIVSPQKLALAGYCKKCPAIFLKCFYGITQLPISAFEH